MAHDKIYGICENKCLVEVPTKEEYEADISLKYPIAVHKEIGRFIKDDHEYKVMHYCSGELDLNNFQYSSGVYKKDISDLLDLITSAHDVIDCYVTIGFNDSRGFGSTKYLEKIPAQYYTWLERGQSGIHEFRFNHAELTGQGVVYCKITIHFEYIKY